MLIPLTIAFVGFSLTTFDSCNRRRVEANDNIAFHLREIFERRQSLLSDLQSTNDLNAMGKLFEQRRAVFLHRFEKTSINEIAFSMDHILITWGYAARVTEPSIDARPGQLRRVPSDRSESQLLELLKGRPVTWTDPAWRELALCLIRLSQACRTSDDPVAEALFSTWYSDVAKALPRADENPPIPPGIISYRQAAKVLDRGKETFRYLIDKVSPGFIPASVCRRKALAIDLFRGEQE